MPKARQSISVWAAYVSVLGALLLVSPNALLGLVGIAETDEVWIRVVGMTVIIFGILYTGAVQADARQLYLASVIGRAFAVVTLVVLAFTSGPWQLVLFAAVDTAGAVWTFIGLRADAQAEATATA